MDLEQYRSKRDFTRTREPAGSRHQTRAELSYVVQKHAARNLHYDFRLELDGVLLSWAVPKGPSLDPSVKRLAMQVEDHPVEYGGFEGTIPKGEYGGGAVMVWDRGTWEPAADPREAYRKGRLTFELHGKKLKGRWHLIRTTRQEQGAKRAWLLFKGADAEARKGNGIAEEKPDSALTGRTLEQISQRSSPPRSVAPELATLVKEPPDGESWIHEVKLDGYRILASIADGKATLLSRNGKDWSDRIPSLRGRLEKLGLPNAVLDGEVVVLRPDGVSDFQLLQNALGSRAEGDSVYYVFDLLDYEGRDLRSSPLLSRKAKLEAMVRKAGERRLRYSDHVVGKGGAVLAHACQLGLEGIVSKRGDSPYRAGRGADWLKTKCTARQEFVILGYTPPRGSRASFGALVMGTREKGRLRYAGKVGTGFTERSLSELMAKLAPLVRKTPALDVVPGGLKGVRWVEPKLVAEVDFAHMTRDGLLRHSSFKGLRIDKPARSVVLEEPARSKALVSNPDRVLFGLDHITKSEIAEYYAAIADRMLPHVEQRPLTLVRCPSGIERSCFYQKNPAPKMSPDIHRHRVSDKLAVMTIDGPRGLLALAQLGVLEIHTWGCHAGTLEKPDLLVFDVDPDESLEWRRVADAARAIRKKLREVRLESFVKTTGGKGLHVCAPIATKAGWDEVKTFCRAVAESIAREDPARYVATMSKARRVGKIYIDYLRNQRGATFIAPYSTRAREHAPVAMPIEWDELSQDHAREPFTVRNALRRLARRRSDPWADIGTLKQELPRLESRRQRA